jgi:adenylate cyclase
MRNKKLQTIRLQRLAIGFFAVFISLLINFNPPSWIAQADESLRDTFVRASVSDEEDTRIVIIDINDASLQEFGEWPWSRSKIASLVEALVDSYGAKAVALDMVFPEAGEPGGDARLAALAAHAPLVLAQVFDYNQREAPNHVGELIGGTPITRNDLLAVEAHGYIANHSKFKNSKCVGNIGFIPDSDGTIRHTQTKTVFNSRSYETLASALAECITETQFESSPGYKKVTRIKYKHSIDSYTAIPASNVLKGIAPKELISNRYVLIGSSSLGIGDRVTTPLSPLTAGVMVHAANLTNILNNDDKQINGAPWIAGAILITWTITTISVIIATLALVSPLASVFILLCFSCAWLLMTFIFISLYLEWSSIAPLIGYLILLLFSIPHEWLIAKQRADFITTTFSRYVSQEIIDELLKLDSPFGLEPKLKNVTVLVADMEGYTQTTTLLSLDEAAKLTKNFLELLTTPIIENRGTLDKYLGDGLVAFWGAPLDCEDQSDLAVSAALKILDDIESFNIQRQAIGLPSVRVRIGIESGAALVGDLGSSFRSTYTAVGDCINFASRLESLALTLSRGLLIGPVANSQLIRHKSISLCEVQLRGTDKKINAYTVDRS